MNKKAILYRIASWPNLTQLMFMYSIPFGGSAWLRAVEEQWPMQNTPMCDKPACRRHRRRRRRLAACTRAAH
jgi:hypothetical protein